MACCRCACISIILGLIAGVILGILYAFGLVSTGMVFWVYLAVGAAGVFLSPIYANDNRQCFCRYRNMILVTSVGSIISAALGLIVEAVEFFLLTGLVLGLATFFVVMLIVSIICLTNSVCDNECSLTE